VKVKSLLPRVACLLLLPVLASLCIRGQTTSETKTDSITGKVVNESGQPLANVSVYVQPMGGGRMNEPATTDRDGTFKVSGLQPVSYTIHVTMPAYVSTSFDPEIRQPKQYKVGDSPTFVLTKGGVITGTVTSTTGEPVIGISVRAQMIRTDKDMRITNGLIAREITTDDRGVYRLYGLPAGTYIVVAGGSQGYGYGSQSSSVFENNLPTYAPSSTRDTAAEITVRPGEEATNIDIRYRGDPGRIVSGVARRTTTGVIPGVSVNLTSAADPPETNVSYSQTSENAGFVFFGVADGDYYLTANTYHEGGEVELSESKLIKVRGADIEGIELAAKPMASITGRVVLEELKTADCKEKERPIFKETFVGAWHRQTDAGKKLPQFIWNLGQPAPADPQGNVTLRNLAPSQYYFAARFTAKSWYVQSITITAPGKPKPVDATRVWTNVNLGEKLSGLTVTLAQGAATLNGQITPREGETLPEKLVVYVVPADKERADDVLRFYGAAVSVDGKIAMNSLAPGRYWVLVQVANEETEGQMRRLRWPDETEMRAKLRRDAEAAKSEVELKACQNVVDFKVPVRQD
jgi:hypothetical protein